MRNAYAYWLKRAIAGNDDMVCGVATAAALRVRVDRLLNECRVQIGTYLDCLSAGCMVHSFGTPVDTATTLHLTYLYDGAALVESHHPSILLRIRHALQSTISKPLKVIPRMQIKAANLSTNSPFLHTELASSSTTAQSWSPPPTTLVTVCFNGSFSALLMTP